MKPIKCELWINTRNGTSINLGTFDSLAACRKYIRECVTGFYQIIKLPNHATTHRSI